jgi:endonuclease/exonuclease/phosphatase family metal-dependent hydrolase
MKILLGDLNAKLDREDIFKQTVGNESLHEISNDNGVRVINFATSPNGKTHNQIDHILIDRRQHSSILGV